MPGSSRRRYSRYFYRRISSRKFIWACHRIIARKNDMKSKPERRRRGIYRRFKAWKSYLGAVGAVASSRVAKSRAAAVSSAPPAAAASSTSAVTIDFIQSLCLLAAAGKRGKKPESNHGGRGRARKSGNAPPLAAARRIERSHPSHNHSARRNRGGKITSSARCAVAALLRIGAAKSS